MTAEFSLVSREAAVLLGGVVLIVGGAFVAARVLRSMRHGWSVRLQLFFAIFVPSLLVTAMIGVWAVGRVHSEAMLAVDARRAGGPPEIVEMVWDFGPKTTLLFVLLAVAAAGAAFALGRGMAHPLENLTRSAEAIARGQRHAVLPPPVGREVRRLTAAFESMRRSLEDRHHIEQFVADLSHELKNPVSAIRAATEVLLEGAADDPAARGRFLARIDEAGGRLEVLLHDLLALARLEARGLEPTELAFDALVRESVEVAGPVAALRGITVAVGLVPMVVHGDAVWLRRAIDNLLSNALRYGPEHSTVAVTLAAQGSCAVLTVRDHGPGVASGLRARLFERFVTDRAQVGGTGLGLAIVRSVAEQHGGSADLVEVQGAGACFEFRVRLGSHRLGALA
jgi:signal transduction histidine kinase